MRSPVPTTSHRLPFFRVALGGLHLLRERISFRQIPDPGKVTSTVRYTGSMTAKGLIAKKLIVEVSPY